MSVTLGLSFTVLNAQILDWTLTDSLTGLPIDNNTVTATLYVGRDRFNPAAIPGVPDSIFNNINLAFVSSGLYQGLIPATFNVEPGNFYLCVIDMAPGGGYGAQHWEIPSIVHPRNTSQ
jgi:hypothetical protein